MALGLGACGPSGPEIRVEGAWLRPDPLMENAAAYLMIYNDGGEADALIGVRSEIAESLSVHETMMMEGGVHGMEPVSRLEVPVGGQVELQPLSLHIMVAGLKEKLEYGSMVTLVLQFEKSGEVTVEAEVRQQ